MEHSMRATRATRDIVPVELTEPKLDTLLKHILSQLRPRQAMIIRLCAIPRWFDHQVVSVLRNRQEGSDVVLQALTEFSFIQSVENGIYTIQDEVRAAILRVWAEQSSNNVLSVHSSLAAHAELRAIQANSGIERQRWHSEYLYHKILSASIDGWNELKQQWILSKEIGDTATSEALRQIEWDAIHDATTTLQSRARYEAANTQAQMLEDQHLYAEAYAQFEHALGIAKANNYLEDEAKTHTSLGLLLVIQGDYLVAEKHFQQAKEIYRRTDNRANLASTLNNQATNYNFASQPRQAVQAAREALIYFEQLREPWGRAMAAQNLAEAYLSLGALHEAQHYAFLVIEEEELTTLPNGLRLLGEVLLAQDRVIDAERYVQRSLELVKQTGDLFLEANIIRTLAKIQSHSGHVNQARETVRGAIELFGKLGRTQELANTLKDFKHLERPTVDED